MLKLPLGNGLSCISTVFSELMVLFATTDTMGLHSHVEWVPTLPKAKSGKTVEDVFHGEDKFESLEFKRGN